MRSKYQARVERIPAFYAGSIKRRVINNNVDVVATRVRAHRTLKLKELRIADLKIIALVLAEEEDAQ